MCSRYIRSIPIFLSVLSLILVLSSCFTGIENTKKIELSRQDKKQLAPTPEESFLKDLDGRPLKDWVPGDSFLIADSRFALLVENSPFLTISDSSLVGRKLSFKGTDSRMRPDRSEECIVLFSDSLHTYSFLTGMSCAKADSALLSTAVPLLIDLRTIEKVRSRLCGLRLWTRSSLWYDPDGEKVTGRKYSSVIIESVIPGSQLFPVKVIFTDDQNIRRMMWMNYTSSTSDSRKFPVLFSLSDRRKDFPNISDENWTLIQNGNVTVGMTKEECKLALGNPADVASGHSHSETMDFWQYPDGTFLRFSDGLLIDFRR